MVVEIIAGLWLGIIPAGIAWWCRDRMATVASLILVAVAGWYLLTFRDAESIAVAATLWSGACIVSTLIHFNNTPENREVASSDDVGTAPSETPAGQQDLDAPRRDRTAPDREAFLDRKRRSKLSSKRRRQGLRGSEIRTTKKA
jgi:hypothetical protein